MLDQTKMNKFKECGGAAALELRGEMVSALKDRINETMKVVNSYFSNKQEKAAAITNRIEELKDQQEDLEAKVAEYGPRLAEATISGNSAALGVIQTELANLEAQKAAVGAQIGLLSGVTVSGDKERFTVADEKARALDRFWTETQADLSALSAFANSQITLWSQVANLSTLGGDIMPRRSVFREVEEMRRDFREVE
ncbi:hypothetical protein ACEVJL_01805 [Pseudoflavonifractor sp. P01025]|uniref:hypothetical protein n=1 Tax=Flintibacter porci TaxID=3342383 RepID=UPI0035B69DD9